MLILRNGNTMEIPCTPKQLEEWHGGGLIQNVMPNLTPEEREFLMTGILPVDWEEMFEGLEEDDF